MNEQMNEFKNEGGTGGGNVKETKSKGKKIPVLLEVGVFPKH